MDLKAHIRQIPDFPKPGILFYDISTLLQAPAAWRVAIDQLAAMVSAHRPDRLVGIESRGFIVAALDNTLGPFSYLIAPPSVTTSLNTQYLRPVTQEMSHIICHARLVERTRTQLFLAGEVRDDAGRVLAMCQAVCQILPPKGS